MKAMVCSIPISCGVHPVPVAAPAGRPTLAAAVSPGWGPALAMPAPWHACAMGLVLDVRRRLVGETAHQPAASSGALSHPCPHIGCADCDARAGPKLPEPCIEECSRAQSIVGKDAVERPHLRPSLRERLPYELVRQVEVSVDFVREVVVAAVG